MLTLRDYVNWGIAHSDNVGKAEGVPLVMEKCKTGRKMKQLEVYGESVQNGTPSPEAPVEVESVGEPCIRNWFDKNKFLSRDGYNVATNYSFYKAKYIEGLKPNTKYNVVVERLNGTTPTSAKCTVLFSGSTFSVAAGAYTSIGHASNATETNGSPYTSDENGRLTVGISTSTTQEQLDLLWKNINVYLYEDGDETTVYKVPLLINEEKVFDLYLNEPLRKIGDYTDILDFKEKKVIRNIYENDFSDINTSSPYSLSTFNPSSELVCFRIAYRGAKLKYAMASMNVKGNAYCNMYPIVSSSQRAEDTLSGGASNSATFDFIDSDYTTQEAWIAHINELTANGTPLKVIHTLKTPYEEAITCELPTLNAKTTVIDIDTSILPSDIKGKYIKR